MAGRAGSESGAESRATVPTEGSLPLADLKLVGQGSRSDRGGSWVARAQDGSLVTVCPVIFPAERPDQWSDLSRLTQVRHPCLVPVLAVGERDGSVWVVSELDRGRPLRRLLAVATLTPEQAAAVVFGTLGGLQALHEAQLYHGRLNEGTVHIGTAGAIRLGGWGLEPEGYDPARRRADQEAAVNLLGRLRRSVHRTGHRHTIQVDVLLEALDACREDTSDAAALLAPALQAAAALLGGQTGDRVARELSSLVAALERDPPSPAVRSPAVTAVPAVYRSQRPSAAVWVPARRSSRWLATVPALLLLVAIGGAAVLTSRHLPAPTHAIAPQARQTPAVQASSPAPTPAPTPAGPRPVPEVAPAAAGPITAVEIHPLQGSCQPATACPVQVTVRLQPQPAAQEVRWSFRVFNRCTGITSMLPGVSVTALAGWPYVFGTSWPQLPDSHPVALLAVTEMPAAAASPALLAGGSVC